MKITKYKEEICKHKWTLPYSTPEGLVKNCFKCKIAQMVHIETMEETRASYDKEE